MKDAEEIIFTGVEEMRARRIIIEIKGIRMLCC